MTSVLGAVILLLQAVISLLGRPAASSNQQIQLVTEEAIAFAKTALLLPITPTVSASRSASSLPLVENAGLSSATAISHYEGGVSATPGTDSASIVPTITFPDFNAIYGAANFTPNITSNSSGGFAFTSSNSNVAVISSGQIVVRGVGTTTITAIQTASGNYSNGSAMATLTVNKGTPALTWSSFSIPMITIAEEESGNPFPMAFSTNPTSNVSGTFFLYTGNPAFFAIDGITGIGSVLQDLNPSVASSYPITVGINPSDSADFTIATASATITPTDPDDCAQNPCVYGSCVDPESGYSFGGFSCSCPSGMTGLTCNVPIDECATNPCGIHGICTRTSTLGGINPPLNSYSCTYRSVAISPTSTSLISGATTNFTSTFMNDPGDVAVWSALYGTIDPVSGAYTAPSVVGSSTLTDVVSVTSQIISYVTASATVAVSSGITGWWPTNEGSGSTAYDVSGDGNNGMWHGSQTGNDGYYTSYGLYTGTFDGSTNYVSTAVSWPTSGTMIVWADPTSLNPWISPAGWKYAPASGGYILVDEGDGSHWRAVFDSSGLGESDIQSTSSISINHWSQIGMTWNKVGATTTITLYVNGVSQGSTTTTQTATSSIGPFYYGTAGQSANNDFTGYIDDVRTYDRALTSSEIQGIYNAEQSMNSSTPAIVNPAA